MANTVYKVITDRILKLLSEGTIPWRKPWKPKGYPRSLFTGRPYRGVNAILLGAAAYDQPYWLTFKQAEAHGGNIRRGERGWPCVFWNVDQIENLETGELQERKTLRYYTVFNIEQAERLEDYLGSEEPLNEFEPVAKCEEVIRGMPYPPKIEHGHDKAAYAWTKDTVLMPGKERFNKEPFYYSTLFHELIHSTGHHKRVGRKVMTDPFKNRTVFGSEEYSHEELVAEMGASFLCGYCGIEKLVLPNSAAYIDGWMRRISSEQTLVLRAGAAAQKAADYILSQNWSEK